MPHHPKSPPVFPYPWASSWGEDRYGLWMALDYKGVEVVFRWIEPGTFTMGSPEGEEGRYDDEDQHEVTLSQGCWMAETTVTQALWEAVMEKSPSEFKGESLPIETISWDDCQAFVKKMSEHHTELELRLPWEAEWEYACRAGAETAFNFGSEISLDEVNYRGVWELSLGKDKEKWNEEAQDQWGEKALKKTCNVKHYPCNVWGLYEMHGNVWEWCQGHWQDSLGKESVTDPKHEALEPEEGALRVIRGGSWRNIGGDVRSACRYHFSPDDRLDYLGLRLSLGQPSGSSRGGSR